MARQTVLFWGITVLLLIWNAMGCLNYIMQTNPENVAKLPEAYKTIVSTRPAWATASFALHVFLGLLGCVLLLARRNAAKYAFGLSMIAGVVFFVFILILFSNGSVDSSVFFGPLLSVLVALFSIAFAKRATDKGVLH